MDRGPLVLGILRMFLREGGEAKNTLRITHRTNLFENKRKKTQKNKDFSQVWQTSGGGGGGVGVRV